jgi:hypothetical protein
LIQVKGSMAGTLKPQQRLTCSPLALFLETQDGWKLAKPTQWRQFEDQDMTAKMLLWTAAVAAILSALFLVLGPAVQRALH